MFNNLGHNNYKNDKLIAMQVRNWFKVNGYYAYYMIKEERGIDTILQELYDNRFNKGFWTPILIPDFNFETSNVFSKFGIQIPDNINFLLRRDLIDDQIELMQSELETDEEFYAFPEEGDLIFLPLQSTTFKSKKLSDLSQIELADLLKSGEDSMNYLFEITYIHDKEYTFNGKSWVLKVSCKIYDKKVSSTFGEDLDIMNNKIKQNPEPTPTYEDPTGNTESQPYYVDKQLKEEIDDLMKFD
jgi:hypothetical protein